VFFLNRFKHLKYLREVMKKELLSVPFQGKWLPGEVADKEWFSRRVQHGLQTSHCMPHHGIRRP